MATFTMTPTLPAQRAHTVFEITLRTCRKEKNHMDYIAAMTGPANGTFAAAAVRTHHQHRSLGAVALRHALC